MDIDVIAKHMPGLLEFKKRIEALLEGAEDGVGAVVDGIKSEVAEIRSHLSETSDAVSGLQKLKDDVSASLGAALESVEARFETLQQTVEDNKNSITVILAFKDEVSPILEGLSGLRDMAEWFAQNRVALEVLLSIGDDLVAPKPDLAPAPAVDPAAQPAADPARVAEQQPSTDQPVT